jgi:hypothetical protein
VFSSHKLRTFQTLEPIAAAHGLAVQRFPPLGSVLDSGEIVSEATSTGVSIEPMAAAILSVAPGSVVVAAGHSGTLYPIMARLGVCVAGREEPGQESDASCLPCADASCFPREEFDNLWVVTRSTGVDGGATMVNVRYGEPVAVAGNKE